MQGSERSMLIFCVACKAQRHRDHFVRCLTLKVSHPITSDWQETGSLADVVAHEITHSWTGNLVTNSSPEHFWLSEGHTVFIERKIAGRLQGEPYHQMMSREGWSTLEETLVLKNGPFTKLILEMEGINPDEAFSSVQYEKGSALLLYLEHLLEGPDVFEPFLKAYIEKFKYKSINSSQWKCSLYEFFAEKKAKLDTVGWEGWFYGQGMPPVKMSYDESFLIPITQHSQKWIAATDDEVAQFTYDDLKDFSPIHMRIFLEQLFDAPNFSVAKVQALENLYHFNAIKNSEVRFKWLRLCIKVQWKDCLPLALSFVNEQGRIKFVRPLYRYLYDWKDVREQAIGNFLLHRVEMHNTTASLVKKDLHL